MITHDYFGEIAKDEWNNIYPKDNIRIPYFEKEVKVRLGAIYDEDYEEITTPSNNM